MNTRKLGMAKRCFVLSLLLPLLTVAAGEERAEVSTLDGPKPAFEKVLPPLRVMRGGAEARSSAPEASGRSLPGLKNLAPTPLYSGGAVAVKSMPVKVAQITEKKVEPSAPVASPSESKPEPKVETAALPSTPDAVQPDVVKRDVIIISNMKAAPEEPAAREPEERYVRSPERGKYDGLAGTFDASEFLPVDSSPDAVRYQMAVTLSTKASLTDVNVEHVRSMLEKRLLERYNRLSRTGGRVHRVEVIRVRPLRRSLDCRTRQAEFDQRVYDASGNRMPALEREYFVVTFGKKGGSV